MPYSKDECSCECFWVTVTMMVVLAITGNTMIFSREAMLSPLREEHALAWASNPAWKTEQCTVLAVGMSNRGACDAESEHYAECPGYAWCADENNLCSCDGDVIFAPGLYGDTWIPDMEKVARLKNNKGNVRCDVHSIGKDPAHGTLKACWCLQKEISDFVEAGGSVHAKKCGSEANHEYFRSVSYSTEASSSLASTEEVKVKDEDKVREGYESEESDLEESEISIEADENTSFLLEIPDHYNSRRRGGCQRVLLPWALVKVKSNSEFGEPDSERLRCAYEFGADAVSRENDVEIAHKMVKQFKQHLDSETDCFTLGSCVVGMASPNILQESELANGKSFWSKTRFWLGALVLIMAVVAVLGGKFEIRGFTPLDFGIWAFVSGLMCSIYVVISCFDGTPGSLGPNAGALLGGLLSIAIILYGMPTWIYYALHKEPTNRPQVLRQASFTTLAVLRRANSIRDVVAGPRRLAMGDRVMLIAAEQGLGANEEGYIAGIDGEQAVFQSDTGDIVRTSTSNVRILA